MGDPCCPRRPPHTGCELGEGHRLEGQHFSQDLPLLSASCIWFSTAGFSQSLSWHCAHPGGMADANEGPRKNPVLSPGLCLADQPRSCSQLPPVSPQSTCEGLT